jgi:YD repeat-containing protein
VGNRLTNLGSAAWSYNTSNELSGRPSYTYTYDNNGNTLTSVTGSNTTTYAWDVENRLKSVTLAGSGGTVSFKYDLTWRVAHLENPWVFLFRPRRKAPLPKRLHRRVAWGPSNRFLSSAILIDRTNILLPIVPTKNVKSVFEEKGSVVSEPQPAGLNSQSRLLQREKGTLGQRNAQVFSGFSKNLDF